jgi:hypothetical protein
MLNAQLQEQTPSEPGVSGTQLRYSENIAPGVFEATSRQSPTRRLGGNLAARPRRSPARPSPRPLPPPGPIPDEDVLANPFKGKALRRSGVGTLPTHDEIPETDLPPTPENPDPEITTPPSGIHSSSPSRRAKRTKALAGMKSSPLKQKPLRPPSPRKAPVRVSEVRGTATESINSAPRLQPVDENYEKRRKRDDLLSEIAQLENDLEVAAATNERLRLARNASDNPPPNADELLDLLRRRVLPRGEDSQDSTTLWLQAALNPINFLPFGRPTASSPNIFAKNDADDEPEPPISHDPIRMTLEEEEPFLHAFTPLNFKSSVVLLPQESETAPLLQRHSMTIESANPSGLFSAGIDMTVNTKSLIITELSVPRLDRAAAFELGPLIERVLVNTTVSSALTRNASVLSWAMGEWYRTALRRARFWHLLDKELGSKAALEETVGKTRMALKSKRGKRSRGDDARSIHAVDEDGQDGSYGIVSRAELLPHMGRTSMDFEIPRIAGDGEKTELRIQWRMEFDWAGEVENRIGALLGVPGKCRSPNLLTLRGESADVPSRV